MAQPPEPAALSPAERVARSKAHFELGRARFNLGEYEAAAREFEEGYRLKPQPLFLYNIAQCHLRADRPDQALAFFRRYLAADPAAPERREVEQEMAQLEERLARTPPAPPVTTEPRSRSLSVPPPEAAPEPSLSAPPVHPPVTTTSASPATAPKSRRWLWVAAGAVALGLAGGTVLWLGGGNGPPSTDLGNTRVPSSQ